MKYVQLSPFEWLLSPPSVTAGFSTLLWVWPYRTGINSLVSSWTQTRGTAVHGWRFKALDLQSAPPIAVLSVMKHINLMLFTPSVSQSTSSCPQLLPFSASTVNVTGRYRPTSLWIKKESYIKITWASSSLKLILYYWVSVLVDIQTQFSSNVLISFVPVARRSFPSPAFGL